MKGGLKHMLTQDTSACVLRGEKVTSQVCLLVKTRACVGEGLSVCSQPLRTSLAQSALRPKGCVCDHALRRLRVQVATVAMFWSMSVGLCVCGSVSVGH